MTPPYVVVTIHRERHQIGTFALTPDDIARAGLTRDAFKEIAARNRLRDPNGDFAPLTWGVGEDPLSRLRLLAEERSRELGITDDHTDWSTVSMKFAPRWDWPE